MMNKKKAESFLSKFKKHSSSDTHSPILCSPRRFWNLSLRIFAVFTVVVLGLSVYTFYRVENNQYGSGNDEIFGNSEPINRTKLESVLNRYEKKSEFFAGIEVTPPVISDPSL